MNTATLTTTTLQQQVERIIATKVAEIASGAISDCEHTEDRVEFWCEGEPIEIDGTTYDLNCKGDIGVFWTYDMGDRYTPAYGYSAKEAYCTDLDEVVLWTEDGDEVDLPFSKKIIEKLADREVRV